jgi:hypothetical protein
MNTVMFEYWSIHKATGQEPRPKEIAAHCQVSIYSARSAVARYRRGRVPVRSSAGLAPKTVKNVHRLLHRAFGDAVAWRYLAANPAEHASLPRQRHRRARTGATWTPEQLAKWLDVAVADRDAALWVLAATTGNATVRTCGRRPRSDRPRRRHPEKGRHLDCGRRQGRGLGRKDGQQQPHHRARSHHCRASQQASGPVG